MTDTTTVTVPEFVTMIDRSERTLPAMAQIATDLLVQADYQQLPAPHYLSISHGGQSITLGFGRDLDACHALARWAEQFGGTVTGTPHTSCEDGQSAGLLPGRLHLRRRPGRTVRLHPRQPGRQHR